MAPKRTTDAAATLAKIREIVAGTNEHRNREKREAWEAIKVLVGVAEPPVETPAITVGVAPTAEVPADEDEALAAGPTDAKDDEDEEAPQEGSRDW